MGFRSVTGWRQREEEEKVTVLLTGCPPQNCGAVPWQVGIAAVKQEDPGRDGWGDGKAKI